MPEHKEDLAVKCPLLDPPRSNASRVCRAQSAAFTSSLNRWLLQHFSGTGLAWPCWGKAVPVDEAYLVSARLLRAHP
ncbi:Hypothetical predicted protein, partial [Marmota monax]